MKTYLIPITEQYGQKYNCITYTHANSSQEAYNKIKDSFTKHSEPRLISRQEMYDIYDVKLNLSKQSAAFAKQKQ